MLNILSSLYARGILKRFSLIYWHGMASQSSLLGLYTYWSEIDVGTAVVAGLGEMRMTVELSLISSHKTRLAIRED